MCPCCNQRPFGPRARLDQEAEDQKRKKWLVRDAGSSAPFASIRHVLLVSDECQLCLPFK